MGAGLVAAVRALAGHGAAEAMLADLAADDGPTAIPRLYFHLHRFGQLGLLEYTVVADGRPLATLVPISAQFELRRRSLESASRWVLSRFAYCRRVGERLAIESPRADCLVRLDHAAIGLLLTQLAEPVSAGELMDGAAGLPHESVRTLLELLAGAGLLLQAGPDGTTSEDHDPAVRQWEFHDLVFHRRSRVGRNQQMYGGTFRFLGQIEPLPALKPPNASEVIELYRPDLEALKVSDLPFTGVVEGRRSVRQYGERPLSARQLGELLFRAARVRQVFEADSTHGVPYATSERPYPGGGACYELELYPVVNQCEGLVPGLYHYDPLTHALGRIRGKDKLVEALIGDVAWVTGGAGEPQVLIGITARFQRVSWKYEGIAYALVLKDVGVLYQTLYLVATAMGLGPCAVGSGRDDLFSAAIGTDYLVESAVGEFMLGSLPSG
jgi:SagB-type dehydrogenase family enzyme